jgi:hypothetical protein
MQEARLISIVLMLLLGSFNPSLSDDVDPLAKQAAETYLKAVKMLQLPEGKALFATVSWKDADRIPTITESTVLFEGMFPTDCPDVLGYKQMLKIRGISLDEVGFVKLFMLVAYQDRLNKAWKVYDFREAVDAEFEAEAARTITLGSNPSMTTEGIHYRHYGYWLMLAGKVTQAQKAFRTAHRENTKNPSIYIPQAEFDQETSITEKILDARP